MVVTTNNSFRKVRRASFRNILVFFITSTLLSFCLPGKAAKIKGLAPQHAGKLIELYTYLDFISEKKYLLAKDTIAEDGSFRLQVDNEETLFCILFVEELYSHIYLQNDQDYELALPSSDSTRNLRFNEFIPADVVILNPEKDSLNYSIKDLNSEVDIFIETNAMRILKRSAKVQADSFNLKMSRRYFKLDNTYFAQQLQFNLALIDLMTGHSKKELYNRYLKNTPLHFRGEAYMKFFNEFYADILSSFAFREEEIKMILAIENSELDSLDAILSSHEFLKRDDVRELAMLQGLYFSQVNGRFKKEQVHPILKRVVQESKFQDHRITALNLLEKSNFMKAGTLAPDFQLQSLEGETVSLSDFKGKYVYLDFWATWCAPCIRSMIVMRELHEKYKEQVEFVSISLDQKAKKARSFVEKNEYSWTFLDFSNQPDIKTKYGIVAIPSYFIIDPEGKLLVSPGPSPEGGAERYFSRIQRDMTEKSKTNFIKEVPTKGQGR